MAQNLSPLQDSFSFSGCPPPEADHARPSSPLAAASAAVVLAVAPLSQAALKRGIDSGRADLLKSVPQLESFVSSLSSSAASDGEKSTAVLLSAVKAFRRERAQVMRSANRGKAATRRKSPGNISKEASIAGNYFERQVGLALIEKMVPEVLEAARCCVTMFGRIPEDTINDLIVYQVLQTHGVASLHGEWEEAAEAHAQDFKEQTITRMVAAGRGRHIDANVRNNAASRKSYAKKTRLCELTRTQVAHILGVRARLQRAMCEYSQQEPDSFEPVLATSAI